jgi:hypothetical protein
MGQRGCRVLGWIVVALAIAGLGGPGTAQAARPGHRCDEVVVPMRDGVRLHGWLDAVQPTSARPLFVTFSSYSNQQDGSGGAATGGGCGAGYTTARSRRTCSTGPTT